MAVKRVRESGSDGGEVEYEKLRNERLRENQKRMEELGILSLSRSLSEIVRGTGLASGRGSLRTSSSSTPRAIVPAGPARRSSRLSGSPAVSYAEVRKKVEGKDQSAGRKARQAGSGGFQPEIYTDEDEKLLGSAKTEWRLFVDGYDSSGTRVYDPVRGKTCHQCRQKTMGLRTSCSNCQSLHGQFCGDCLFMRYGENVVEANENEKWECPVCRGICNCSFCRLKRGWTPTGALYRRIQSLGYKSVAHYLVLTRRGDNEEKEADDKKLPSKQAPNVENTEKEALPTLVAQKQESENQEKVPEIQSTLVSSPGWRSRRAVTTKSVDGAKTKNSNSSESPTTFASNEAAAVMELNANEPQPRRGRGRPPNAPNEAAAAATELNANEPQQPRRGRGRPPKNKAAFYASAPKPRLEAKPEPDDVDHSMRVLVLDSDSEESSDRLDTNNESIAQRLRRRITC